MPSKRKQLNVRLSDDSELRLEELVLRMRAALGIEVSKSDVIHAALVELEKRYPPIAERSSPATVADSGKGKRKQKQD